MIQHGSGLSEARPEARLFRAWTLLAGTLALLPVVRIWQLTGDADTTVTTVALFAGAAWQIGRLLPRVGERPNRDTRWLAIALLALGMWQLAWIGTDDFWFFRVALILWAAVWLLLAWGVAGLVWGWRVLAAFAVWAAFCDAPWQWSRDGYQSGDFFGPKLAIVTARISGGVLALAGVPVKVDGKLIQLGGHVVSVGVPCTALPLAKLLMLLLVLATLLFRLDWLRALWLAAVTLVLAFAISVARVMLLAYVVRDPRLFHYWHDPDGGGGGWFTAMGMLAIAFLIARQVFRQRLSPPGSIPPGPPPPAPDARWIAAASVAALAFARLSAVHPARDLPPPVLSPQFSLVSDAPQWMDPDANGRAEPNAPSWVRRVDYAALTGSTRLKFIIASIPRTLSGDPLRHPALNAQIPVRGAWNVPRGSRYAVCQSAAGSAWVTTIAPDEAMIATAAAWRGHLRRAWAQPRRWLAWLGHRAPLRDKRSYWLGAYETDGSAPLPAAPPNLFSDWVAVLAHSF